MTRSDLFEELRRETEFMAEHTRRQYFNHVSQYLDYVGRRDWKDRDLLYQYTQVLKSRGMTQQTINYVVRGPIGALFRCHGLRVPIKLPRPKVSGSIIDLIGRVQFSVNELEAIIRAAKSGTRAEQAVFAVATTYGPRVGEVQRISSEDVRPSKRTLVIHTEKGGLQREHVVPDAIGKFVFEYDWPAVSMGHLYLMFNTVVARAGIDRVKRKSWHAIRHGLFAAMIHDWELEQSVAYTFLRWRQRDMIGVYAPYDPKNDAKVFAKHGLLAAWE